MNRFTRIFLLLAALGAFVPSTITVAVDPFWIWQKNPPWVESARGNNMNLDQHMRRAKTLQVAVRQPETILLGSSKVYRGFDTGAAGEGVYNLGITGLTVREMEGYVDHVLRWTPVKRIVIGLDYFMFDRRTPFQPGYDAKISKPSYLPELLLASVFSYDALKCARIAMRGSVEDGRWNASGYKTTPPSDAKRVRAILAVSHDNLQDVVPDAEADAALARLLEKLAAARVTVWLYISPMHVSQRETLKRAGAWPSFDAWRGRIKTIAGAQHIFLYDFTHAPFGDDERLMRGSTEWWLEPTHFSPKTGAWILAQMNVSLAE